MTKQNKKSNRFLEFLKVNNLSITLFVIFFILTILTYQIILTDKFSLLTFIGDTNVSLLTNSQSIRAFEGKLNKRLQTKLQFVTSLDSFEIDLATSSAKIDYSPLYQAFANQHPQNLIGKIQKSVLTIFQPLRIYPTIDLSLEQQLDNISKAIDQPAVDAQLIFDETEITTKAGVNGLALDQQELKNTLANFLLTGEYNNSLPLKNTPPKVLTEHVARAKTALLSIGKQPIKLTFEEKTWVIDAKQLLTLLDLTQGINLLHKDQTENYVKTIALEIDSSVQEGLFEFNPTAKRVSAFQPSREGRKLDLDKTLNLITDSLTNNSSKTLKLPIDIVKPKIQTSDVNSLGINELLGKGISNFAGSIPNRIYNVNLTARKINGILIPPGEIFSFNQTVGDITAATGFKQAYVIKEGRTVLDDGGGVCQDSTTLFRAVLNAGLPIVKRTAHAYRVGYYEQGFPPGLDATIFYPSVDFQFKNDTSSHILIQAYTTGLTLYIDLYGTSDGRVATLTKPIVTNIIPAPPELRQDDPTLPKGVVKQVDWAAVGATVTFTRNVTRNSEVIHKEVWKSIYKPWQAIYLVGIKE